MNNLSSYCGLFDARISASDKDLPVQMIRAGRAVSYKLYQACDQLSLNFLIIIYIWPTNHRTGFRIQLTEYPRSQITLGDRIVFPRLGTGDTDRCRINKVYTPPVSVLGAKSLKNDTIPQSDKTLDTNSISDSV